MMNNKHLSTKMIYKWMKFQIKFMYEIIEFLNLFKFLIIKFLPFIVIFNFNLDYLSTILVH